MIVDSGDFDLKQEDDGSWKTTVGLTNTTISPIEITGAKSRNSRDTGCSVTPGKDKLPPQQRTEVDVTVSAGCAVRDDGFNFLIQSSAPIPPIAAAPPDETPDWDELRKGFLIGGFGALLVLLLAQVGWWGWDRWDERKLTTKEKEKKKSTHSLLMPLKQLEDTWSFADSWVANLTIAGGLLVALLGNTEVIKAALGEDSEPAIALVTVSAAIGAAFVAGGQLFVLATKQRRGGGWKKKGWVTVGGLYGGALLTLAGAFGQMWIVATAADTFELGSLKDAVTPFAIAAAALLTLYAVRTLLLTLEMGTNPPEEAPTDDSKLLIAAVLRADGMTPARIPSAIDSLDDAFKDYAAKKEKAAKDAKQANAKERDAAKDEAREPDLIKVPNVSGSPVAEPQRAASRARRRSAIL